MSTVTNSMSIAVLTVLLLSFIANAIGHNVEKGGEGNENFFNSLKNNIIGDGPGLDDIINVFFGNDDEEHQKEELTEHFGYLRGGSDESAGDIAQMAASLGIKPEFLNFKAHDYDNNDKIDGLELLNMMERDHPSRLTGTHTVEQRLHLISQIIDRLFQEEDQNQDGFLDFTEYNNARLKLTRKV